MKVATDEPCYRCRAGSQSALAVSIFVGVHCVLSQHEKISDLCYGASRECNHLYYNHLYYPVGRQIGAREDDTNTALRKGIRLAQVVWPRCVCAPYRGLKEGPTCLRVSRRTSCWNNPHR